MKALLKQIVNLFRRFGVALGIGVVIGAVILLGIRFVSYKPVQVHYHANFAVYINGVREQFKGPQYYQDVAACSTTNDITIPQQRAHMHDDLNSLVHLHDHAATCGQFFENLEWYVGPDFIETADGTMYQARDNSELHIIINGQDYTGLTPLTNTVIQDKSRVLISYGDITKADIAAEYKSVPATAAHYDQDKDPASCSGSEKITTKDRLHHLL